MHFLPVARRYRRQTHKIMARVPYYAAMSDAELKNQTLVFKDRLAKGASLNSLMVDAFALVCEADKRVLGLQPYVEQVLGAVAMAYGNIIEMKTGEGKTLTATMPMYLHGLTGPGNFLVTANGYLANRDAADMGRVYRWLGLTVAAGVLADEDDTVETRDKTSIYQSDIVYTTNSGLGFDYLFDNLAATKDKQYMPAFNFAILDEADSILLDSATTPLVIAGVPRVKSNLYQLCDDMFQLLEEDVDYKLDEEKQGAWYTETGIKTMERLLGVKDLLGDQWQDLYRHMILALRAHVLMTAGRDYIVDEGQVMLLDSSNGRKLPGMKLQAGMNQAVEAKEHVAISNEQRAMASVTYQNLFRMFHQLAGMTGTAKTDQAEIQEIYHLSVFVVPTHKPNVRIDHQDRTFISNAAKMRASLDEVEQIHASGRPVLIETGSLTLSHLYSRLLLREHLSHNLLNARSSAKEANIIATAGQPGAITVATSMVGRGTDIVLGKGVAAKGGLFVLGTERMDNQRIDNQLRGRSGRQGDPGETRFYTSLEDLIVQKNAPARIKRFRAAHAQDAKQELTNKRKYQRVIDNAQRKLMARQRNARFTTLQYGEVFRIQRDSVYATRETVMTTKHIEKLVEAAFNHSVTDFVAKQKVFKISDVLEFIFQNVDPDFNQSIVRTKRSAADVHDVLLAVMRARMQTQHDKFTAEDQWIYFQRLALLKAIDTSWIDQVDNLQTLQSVTASRGMAQHNPIYEYQTEAQKSFAQMKTALYRETVRLLLQSEFKVASDGKVQVTFP